MIKDLPQLVGQETTVQGWAYNVRSSGKIAFMQIRDGSGFVQVIIDQGKVDPVVWEAVQKTTIESSVEITGIVSKHPKLNQFELQATRYKLQQRSDEYPIGKKEHGPDFLLDNRHLWIRSQRQWAILRVRDRIITATNEWLHQHDFIKFDSPILTPSACEGTTELFEINYFDEDKAYLSQSGQLYLEAAIASLGRVYDFGPVFRAEKSKTRRHLTEFWMMDAEAAFVDHQGNLAIQESIITHIVQQVLECCQEELLLLERDQGPLKKVQPPFVRMTHAEAVLKLHELGSDIGAMDDLGGDDETLLTKQYEKPIFIEQYPAAVKAFYMKRNPTDPTRALNDDLLAPEGYGEIIGGSQREDDYDILLARVREQKLPEADFRWYLDLRKYGSVPHSGFGYGLERIVAWICGLQHVRETIPFPRLINRIRP